MTSDSRMAANLAFFCDAMLLPVLREWQEKPSESTLRWFLGFFAT